MITSKYTSEFEKEFGLFIEEIGKHLTKKEKKAGRQVFDPVKALYGILYVLKAGCQWRRLLLSSFFLIIFNSGRALT